MMIVDHQRLYLSQLRSAFSVLIYPIKYTVHLPIQMFNWTTEMMQNHASLVHSNAQMHTEQLLLNAKIQRFEILEEENKRLREILKFSRKLDERILVAELLLIDIRSFRHQVTINKGQHHDVYIGQPIIDTKGIMGQIVHTGPFSSTALLLTDSTHAIPVQVNRNGLKSIARGTGQSHLLQLEYLPNNADIKEGDVVISSGLGDRFPTGYPVGVVNNIYPVSGEDFLKVTVIPSTQLIKNREILLIWTNQIQQVESISNTPVAEPDQ